MAKGLPTLVMLPGTLCDSRIFQRQKRALRGLADVRLVDYKHLKLGQTWLTQLLKSLPEKFSVAGFSLGGIWALELLRQAPERIERLAMLASNAQADSPKGRRNSRRLKRLWPTNAWRRQPNRRCETRRVLNRGRYLGCCLEQDLLCLLLRLLSSLLPAGLRQFRGARRRAPIVA